MNTQLPPLVKPGLWAVALAALLSIYPVYAAPVVSNVNVMQRTDGSGLVDIFYDLASGIGVISVSVQGSTDGGATWDITPQAAYLSGDVGASVSNGAGKHIVWDFGADRPGLCSPNTRFRVVAEDEDTAPGPVEDLVITLPGNVPLVLVWVPAGTFMMGRYPGEQDSYSSEDPQHQVTLSQGFYMGKYEVTQQQWLAVRGSWPGTAPSSTYGVGNNYPAYYVSWNDAQNFMTSLNTHITSTGQGPATVRLPSEAEWEYACRADTTTRHYWGDDPEYTQIGSYAWYVGNNSPYGTKPVGGKLPNAFGLNDMSGNVYEWCEDDWHTNYTGAPNNGSAWVNSPRGSYRLLRGGSWNDGDLGCRAAFRVFGFPGDRHSGLGFRVVWTQ